MEEYLQLISICRHFPNTLVVNGENVFFDKIMEKNALLWHDNWPAHNNHLCLNLVSKFSLLLPMGGNNAKMYSDH